jgi:hypothetical protein
MNRRIFLLALPFLLGADTRPKQFRFRIRTKSGSIINTTVEGQNLDHAKSKLQNRYPDCQILSSKAV